MDLFTYAILKKTVGASAYEIAVLEGFIGTEPEWIASLEGPKGVQGIQGDVGPKGEDGLDLTVVQTLTEQHKTNARENIGIEPAYGEVYRYENNGSFPIPPGSTYVLIPSGTSPSIVGELYNVGFAEADRSFVIEDPGLYWVCLTFSSLSGTNQIVLDTAVFKNGLICEKAHIVRKMGNATDISTGTATAMIRCTAGDRLSVRVRHNNIASVNLTVKYGNFNLAKIAD